MNFKEHVYIWGGGLIGYTLAQAFATQKKQVVIIDIDKELIKNINNNYLPRPELCELMDPLKILNGKFISAIHVDQFEPAEAAAVHFLSVPTEKNGETLYDPVQNAVLNIVKKSNKAFPVYLIAESTISPNWFARIHETFQENGWSHANNYHVGASPRRDVFNSNDLKMQKISKIIGGDSVEIVDLMKVIYNNIAGELHIAVDAKHAMLVKVVENYLRESSLNIVNALASAFPDYDMVDVFELAATKWNIEKYHPSLGIGGYCIPLARKYMADAAKDNTDFEKLFSFSDVGQSLMPTLLNLIENSSCKSVAILGLSYGPSFKVHTNSPTFAIIKQLSPIIDNVSVHDPFYSAEEINALTGCTAIENLKELSDFDAVIIVTPHPYYTNNFTDILTAIKKNNSLLIDNLGVFRELASSVVRYWEVGSKAAENI